MRAAALLLVLGAAACSAGSELTPVDAALDRPFEVRVGQAAVLPAEGLSIVFQQVRNDSRCPVDVQCVWEGDAELVLEVQASPSDREQLSLHTSSQFGTSVDFGAYRILYRELQPGTRAGESPDPNAYVATLVVSRID